ncbi:MAG: hypothetical protein JSS62_06170 [Verrucomicrobia bacterium]|nr:hypothetical protein [Verrucomicrobiota bacterium]MBS0647188.1 hypothetical protein [Verrucomicrobiota bacterium]
MEASQPAISTQHSRNAQFPSQNLLKAAIVISAVAFVVLGSIGIGGVLNTTGVVSLPQSLSWIASMSPAAHIPMTILSGLSLVTLVICIVKLRDALPSHQEQDPSKHSPNGSALHSRHRRTTSTVNSSPQRHQAAPTTGGAPMHPSASSFPPTHPVPPPAAPAALPLPTPFPTVVHNPPLPSTTPMPQHQPGASSATSGAPMAAPLPLSPPPASSLPPTHHVPSPLAPPVLPPPASPLADASALSSVASSSQHQPGASSATSGAPMAAPLPLSPPPASSLPAAGKAQGTSLLERVLKQFSKDFPSAFFSDSEVKQQDSRNFDPEACKNVLDDGEIQVYGRTFQTTGEEKLLSIVSSSHQVLLIRCQLGTGSNKVLSYCCIGEEECDIFQEEYEKERSEDFFVYTNSPSGSASTTRPTSPNGKQGIAAKDYEASQEAYQQSGGTCFTYTNSPPSSVSTSRMASVTETHDHSASHPAAASAPQDPPAASAAPAFAHSTGNLVTFKPNHPDPKDSLDFHLMPCKSYVLVKGSSDAVRHILSKGANGESRFSSELDSTACLSLRDTLTSDGYTRYSPLDPKKDTLDAWLQQAKEKGQQAWKIANIAMPLDPITLKDLPTPDSCFIKIDAARSPFAFLLVKNGTDIVIFPPLAQDTAQILAQRLLTERSIKQLANEALFSHPALEGADAVSQFTSFQDRERLDALLAQRLASSVATVSAGTGTSSTDTSAASAAAQALQARPLKRGSPVPTQSPSASSSALPPPTERVQTDSTAAESVVSSS